MSDYILGFKDIDKTTIALVGGKGANLGELYKIPGVLGDFVLRQTHTKKSLVITKRLIHY